MIKKVTFILQDSCSIIYFKFVVFTFSYFLLLFVFGCSKAEKSDNKAPTCQITSPENNYEVEQGVYVDITANAEDADGIITEMHLYADESFVGTSSSPFHFLWNTTGVETGRHSIKIIVTDEGGSTTSDKIFIYVAKQENVVFINDSVKDFDGNIYRTVKIGNQWWMAENMKTTHFEDGTEIPMVESNPDWKNLSYTDKAYCYYDNSLINAERYGKLYTWAAAMNGAATSELNPSNVQGICPCGWHLPSDAEWIELEMFLGMSFLEADAFGWRGTDEGDQMKTTSGWFNSGNGTNISGFSALPGGERVAGPFTGITEITRFWSTTEYINLTHLAFNRSLSYKYSQVGWFSANHLYGFPKNFGFSVRCVKN
jgi:uncharacterized protein (TIGR02145 family)